MTPKQAWGVVSLIVVLIDLSAVATLPMLGVEIGPVIATAAIILLVYFYVLYKRFHVEVVPEGDIMLFTEKQDLEILCDIYSLESSGTERELRQRLADFSRMNEGRTFTWVAPRAIVALGSALTASSLERRKLKAAAAKKRPAAAGTDSSKARSLVVLKQPAQGRPARVSSCPICEAARPAEGTICSECGADLEFYAVLSGSKVGKRIVKQRASSVRRKLRYDVATLGGPR